MTEFQARHNNDRMRRAESWYKHSLDAKSDDDKFIFLWVAFNAAYGRALLDPNVHNGSARSAQKEWNKLEGFLGNSSTKTPSKRFERPFGGQDCRICRGMGYSTGQCHVC